MRKKETKPYSSFLIVKSSEILPDFFPDFVAHENLSSM